mmetsp:Transcript_19357/g.52362  ORF Transcript_19357/g.52362 Transcript_19357/m.52362 type:complete len:226 (-) Transcript_19357:848-1525(-)
MSSWLSASARKYDSSFSTSPAPSTPRTLRIESILSRFCSSGGSGSSSFWIFPSTRKPASLHSSSSMCLMFSLSICPREIGPLSPSPSPVACAGRWPGAPLSPPGWKMCSDGGNQLRPSCCSWMILSACSTRRIRSVTVSSFICHTSRYRFVSATSKCWNLLCRSLNCSVIRLYSSVRSAFSCLKRRSSRAYLALSDDSTSAMRVSFFFCCLIVFVFSESRSTSTR